MSPVLAVDCDPQETREHPQTSAWIQLNTAACQKVANTQHYALDAFNGLHAAPPVASRMSPVLAVWIGDPPGENEHPQTSVWIQLNTAACQKVANTQHYVWMPSTGAPCCPTGSLRMSPGLAVDGDRPRRERTSANIRMDTAEHSSLPKSCKHPKLCLDAFNGLHAAPPVSLRMSPVLAVDGDPPGENGTSANIRIDTAEHSSLPKSCKHPKLCPDAFNVLHAAPPVACGCRLYSRWMRTPQESTNIRKHPHGYS
jgi:hypothetical protein